jgi:hypothetical protein
MDGIVGGWSLNVFFTIQSGQPLAIAMSDNRLADGNQRPFYLQGKSQLRPGQRVTLFHLLKSFYLDKW